MNRRGFLTALAGLPFLPSALSALPAALPTYETLYFVGGRRGGKTMYCRIRLELADTASPGAFCDAMIREMDFVTADIMRREERALFAST